MLGAEALDQPVDNARVEVVAAQVRVAVGALDLKEAVAEVQDGDVEGATAQVVNGDGLLPLLIESVGQRGGGGLVDDAQHLQAGDLAGVLGGLPPCDGPDQPLRVAGDGDDRGRGARALGAFDHQRLAPFHHRGARVRGPQVDTNYVCHHCSFFTATCTWAARKTRPLYMYPGR